MHQSKCDMAKRSIMVSERIDLIITDESEPQGNMIEARYNVGYYLAGDILQLSAAGIGEINLSAIDIESVSLDTIVFHQLIDGHRQKVMLRLR